MKGYAPGWQVRSTKCEKIKDVAEVGMIRISAASIEKRTPGWCSRCRWFRMIVIERKPDSKN